MLSQQKKKKRHNKNDRKIETKLKFKNSYYLKLQFVKGKIMIKKILLWLKISIFAIFAITPVLINTSARSNSQQNLVQSSAASSGSEVVITMIPKVGLWNHALGTNITKGQHGTIFQAKNGDLYAMGFNTGLQVLKGDELTSGKEFEIPGTNITEGKYGTIFQAQNGDLYAMGYETGLEVLKGGDLTDENTFVAVQRTNITKGQHGTIFQAKNGDLYAMGYETGLEVLKGGDLTDENTFVAVQRTNITKGQHGTIFQAKNGDLYAMGYETGLEVLKGGELTSENTFVAALGTNITKGQHGTIFQAKNGDLYAMGYETGLEVLKGGKLTDGSQFETVLGTNITKGQHGTIFQAQNGDLYAMGYETGLEVLKGGDLTDENTFIAVQRTNITKGQHGTIFQAKNGDLYVMGYDTGFEVLKGGDLTDENTFVTAPGTTITKGQHGTIFQAKNGDLYAMGYEIGLEVLNGGKLTGGNEFVSAPGTTITDGGYGTIFQAQNGDLYAMGYETGLEVLLKFIKTDETEANANDGTITVANFNNDSSKLQYKKVGVETWTDLLSTGIIQGLSPGKYQFQWRSKNGAHYVETTNETQSIPKLQEILAWNSPKLVTNVIAKFKSIYSGGLKASETNDNNLATNVITRKRSSLPSELVGTITVADNLGFTEPSPLTGVTVTYSIASHDNTTGTIIIQVIITLKSASSTSTTVYFKLSGYQTTAQRSAQVAVDDATNWFKETFFAKILKKDIVSSQNVLGTSKKNNLPSEIFTSNKVSPGIMSIFGFDIVNDNIGNDVNVVYTIDWGDVDDSDGTLIVKATISKEKATPQVVYFKLSKYQTNAQRRATQDNQQAIADAIVKFEARTGDGLKAHKINDNNLESNLITGKESSLPSELVENVSATNLGFTEPSPLTGVNVVYLSLSHDDTTGTIIVLVNISSLDDSISDVFYFKLSGYQTTAQRRTAQDNQQAVADAIVKFEAEIGNGLKAHKINDNNLESNLVTDKEFSLPSKLVENVSTTNLGFVEPSPLTGVNVVYSSPSHDDATGTIIVQANISSLDDSISNVVYFKLSGYLTSDQKAINDAMKVINDANVNYDGTNLAAVTDWTTFTSGTFGIDISPIPSDVTIEYQHPIVAKDKSFTILFKVTKGSTSKEFTKEINVVAKKDESNNAIILGTTIPIGIIFLAGMAYLILRKMKKK